MYNIKKGFLDNIVQLHPPSKISKLGQEMLNWLQMQKLFSKNQKS